MCIAIFKPANATLTKKVLRMCWENNPDGAGFMLADSDELVTIKGFMTFRRFYKAFRIAEHTHRASPFVLHFRIGTSGSNGPEMTHPFTIHPKLAFVHNGILREFSPTPSQRQDKSDTALFAEVLAELEDSPISLESSDLLQMVDDYAADNHSKFVFLDSSGRHHISGERAGIWHSDCWFSNTSYKESYWGFGEYEFGGWRLSDEEEEEEGGNFVLPKYATGRGNERHTSTSLSQSFGRSAYIRCDSCHDVFAADELMESSFGLVCPDCYKAIVKDAGICPQCSAPVHRNQMYCYECNAELQDAY